MVENSDTGKDNEVGRIFFEPLIVALVGTPLTGKTTIGTQLAKRSNLVFLDVDDTRLRVFGKKQERQPGNQEIFAMQTSYQANHETARDLLNEGRPVVLAATYSRDLYHEMLIGLAEKMHVPLYVFFLNPQLSNQEVDKRLEERKIRGVNSNVESTKAYEEVRNRYRLIRGVNVVQLDTSSPDKLEENISQIMQVVSEAESV